MSWSNVDAVKLKAFLQDQTGQNLLVELRAVRPKLGGLNNEERAIRSAIAEGAEGIVDYIPMLAEFTEENKPKSPFVSIRDNARNAEINQPRPTPAH